MEGMGDRRSLPKDKSESIENMSWLYDFPQISTSSLQSIRKTIDQSFFEFSARHGEGIENFFDPLLSFLLFTEKLMTQTPWFVILGVISILAWRVSHSVSLTMMATVLFVIIGLFGLWEDTMQTLSIILVATFVCIIIGIPIGTLMHSNKVCERMLSPLLDVMQTIPTFVYLIPIIMLLGIGKVPGLIAVCVYSVPPIIRLTNLGLKQVSVGYVEAGMALGLSRQKILWMVKYPLATKSIMTGVNQTIMMCLSMVVIASMIGVAGLGANILKAISNQYLTMGLFNGIAIVTIAIVLDRLFQSYTKEHTPDK